MLSPEIIRQNFNNCLSKTNFTGLGKLYRGKVRDNYTRGNQRIIIATDRQSAFDRILASVPFKGQVLNQISEFWFKETRDIIDNHLLEVPDPNVTLARSCEIVPVEVVVRAYITGVTDTSAWVAYTKGKRNFCGNILPEGLKKNQKFDRPIITPTTKAKGHDRAISPEEIIKEGLVVEEEKWREIEKKALELFERGAKIAEQNGLILVDTKYEFGLTREGNIILADEVHTPDSSRFWLAESYQQRFEKGEEPEYIDKEFLRLWFVEHSRPYKDKILPEAPEDLIIELARRYILLYEKITGQEFVAETEMPILERIEKNLENYFI